MEEGWAVEARGEQVGRNARDGATTWWSDVAGVAED